MAELLQVRARATLGKHKARQQRASGEIPAVLYGHGLEVVNLSLDAAAIGLTLRHGARLVELAGAVQESAFIREVQWDPFGTRVLHVDFTRVSVDELVEVSLPVELKGTAAGTKEGGVVQHYIHEVTIECPAGMIPEKLVVNINALALNGSITVAAIDLPAGAKMVSVLDGVVAQCQLPEVEDEAETAAPGAVEPEVIGRKPTDEEEAEGA